MARLEVSDSLVTKLRSKIPAAGSKGSVFVIQTRSRSADPLVFVLCPMGEASFADALAIASGSLLAMGEFCVDNEGVLAIEVKQNLLTNWPSSSEEKSRRAELEKEKIQLKVYR